MRYILLSKDYCTKCIQLKNMLAKPLKGRYDNDIEVVHKEQQEERFSEYVNEYGINSAPVIINTETGDVLFDTSSIQKVKSFLE